MYEHRNTATAVLITFVYVWFGHILPHTALQSGVIRSIQDASSSLHTVSGGMGRPGTKDGIGKWEERGRSGETDGNERSDRLGNRDTGITRGSGEVTD